MNPRPALPPAMQVGDTLPEVTLDELVGAPSPVPLRSLFAGKKGVLFGVPGAFTPGCSKTHLPGYVADREALAAAGRGEWGARPR